MTELDYRFYSELQKDRIGMARVSKSIKDSLTFKSLLKANIIDTERSGRGSFVFIKNVELFANFFNTHFPGIEDEMISKSGNIRKLRNSKARKVDVKSLFLIRGFTLITINKIPIDLRYFTESFGIFSVVEPEIQAERICFVENLESFLKAETLFGTGVIFIHKYGRIGIQSLKNITAKEVVVFVDYDFNGLDEYLRIRNQYPEAVLYIPQNFDELFQTYSKPISGQQKQSERVLSSTREEIIKIRELVSRTNRFLEQEILTHD